MRRFLTSAVTMVAGLMLAGEVGGYAQGKGPGAAAQHSSHMGGRGAATGGGRSSGTVAGHHPGSGGGRPGTGVSQPPGGGRGRPGTGPGRTPATGGGRPPGTGPGRTPVAGGGRTPGTGGGRAPGTAGSRNPGTGGGRSPGTGGGRNPSPVIANSVIRSNVLTITYISTISGFTITGTSQVTLTDDCVLDPGDVVVQVGNVPCTNTSLSLSELIDQAYQSGALVVVIRDVNTGDLVNIDLPPADDGGQNAG